MFGYALSSRARQGNHFRCSVRNCAALWSDVWYGEERIKMKKKSICKHCRKEFVDEIYYKYETLKGLPKRRYCNECIKKMWKVFNRTLNKLDKEKLK